SGQTISGTPALDREEKLLMVPCTKPGTQEQSVVVWDLERNVQRTSWPYPARRPGSSMVTSLSPDGKHLAVLTQHGDLALHDALPGNRLAELQRGVALALHQEVLHWLSDGRRLLAAHFCGPLKVWELSAPPPVQMVASGTVPAWPVATALAGGVV